MPVSPKPVQKPLFKGGLDHFPENNILYEFQQQCVLLLSLLLTCSGTLMHPEKLDIFKTLRARHLCLTLIILATQETEIRRIAV
jgi:hypothetical protein